jgi:hypothetical protein
MIYILLTLYDLLQTFLFEYIPFSRSNSLYYTELVTHVTQKGRYPTG